MTRDDLFLLEQIYCAKSRKSLYVYRQYISDFKLKKNWFVKEMTQALQQFYEDYLAGKRPILIIQAPPQNGKSEAVTDAINWIAGKNPNLRFIYSSFSERLGIRANLKTQRTMSRPKYKKIFPNTIINSRRVVTSEGYQRNREMVEFIDHEGSFRNTTVEGAVTGETLDIGVIDDPIKGYKSAKSMTARNSVWSWFTDDFMTRFDEMAGLIVILTRWHIDDLAGRLIESDPSVKVLTYKAIAEEDEEFRKEGEALFPEHKSLEFLLKRKEIMLDSSWSSLYQQNPTVAGGNMFQSSWFKPISSSVIDSIKFAKRFITADTALKDKVKNDYTVYSAWGVFENKLYLIDRYRGKPRSKQREIIAKDFYSKNNKYPFRGMYIEQKASGVDLYQRMIDDGYMVFEVERNIDKFERGENVSSYFEIYGIHYNEGIDDITSFIAEVEQFPDSTHDDQVDTLMDALEITYMTEDIDYSKLM